MLPGTRSGLLNSRRLLLATVTVVMMALTAVPAAQGAVVGAPIAPASVADHAASPIANHVATTPAPTVARESPRPAAANEGNLTFYANASVSAGISDAQMSCEVFNYTTEIENECYNWTVNPTLVTLPGHELGVSYQTAGNILSFGCPSSEKANFTTVVAWSRSSDNGTTWGSPQFIGNRTCAWTNDVEPSFASTDGGGLVYGVFVEDNESTVLYTAPGALNTRAPSALAFTKSTNGGASFSNVKTLSGAGSFAAHPEIAVFGQTIYVVWMNISNSSTSYVTAGGPYYTPSINPSAVEFMDSTNGGATWSAPAILPGYNSTAYYLSMNPSIAVNQTGAVAVSYFTNEGCPWNEYGYSCTTYGINLYVVSSTNNGTTWTTPSLVQANLGMSVEDAQYQYAYDMPDSNWIPQSQVRFSPDGSTILVAYSGVYDTPNLYTNPYYYYSAGYFASGPANGLGPWSAQLLASDNTTATLNSFYLPAVSESPNGTLYYAYEEINDTYCYGTTCPVQDGAEVELLRVSYDGGSTWSSPTALNVARDSQYYSEPYYFEEDYQGYEASVGFAASGNPVVVYPTPTVETYTFAYAGGIYYYNYTYGTRLLAATPYTGAVVQVQFVESGLPTADWSFNVQGVDISVIGYTNYTVLNIPVGISLSISPNSAGSAYGQETVGDSSVPATTSFTSNTTVFFNFSVSWELQISVAPALHGYMDYYWSVGSTTYEFYDGETYCYGTPIYCVTYPLYYYPTLPWYFPNGTVVDIGGLDAYGGIDFWNGTGNGSFTGLGTQANVTMDHYINETGWVGAFGVYDERFQAQGLPSTSVYHFSFNGSEYSTPATQAAYVDGVLTGSYAVSDIWANSSTAGYEYFGTPTTPNPVIVPAEPIVNLSFSLVDLASAPGTVTFHAVGLTTGTVWHFSFNGTEYSSSTPYLNVTTRDGTFPIGGYPVVAANGTAGYTPSGLASTLSVTTGSTYDISYSSAYRVVAQAGNGGSISGTGHGTLWLTSGSTASFHAIANTNYLFGGWTGTGAGSYTGNNTYANVTVNAAMTEVASFFPTNANRFNLTFHENGLAPGMWWTVYLGGKGYSSDQSQIVVANLYPCGTDGTYNLSVPYAYLNGSQLTRYAPGAYAKTTCTNGLTVDTLEFSPQYFVTLQSTAGGIGELTVGSTTSTISLWVANQSSVQLSESANTGYEFLGWNGTGVGSYTGPSQTQGIVVSNPLTELAAFAVPIKPAPLRYWENITVTTTLSPGTVWSVSFGGTAYSSTGTSINVTSLLPTTYTLTVQGAYSPDGLTRYAPISPPSSIPVTHNGTTKLTYAVSYWVTVSAGAGGTISAPSTAVGWYSSGATLSLSATPALGYVFLGWVGTGASGYSGASENQTVTVKSPVTEVASFGLAPPTAKIVSQTSVWQNSTTWIGLAAIGLVVGALVGLLVGRRRSGGSGGENEGTGGAPPDSGTSVAPPGGNA